MNDMTMHPCFFTGTDNYEYSYILLECCEWPWVICRLSRVWARDKGKGKSHIISSSWVRSVQHQIATTFCHRKKV